MALPDPSVLTENIIRAYQACTPAFLALGSAWYQEAHDLAESIGPIMLVAGVLAALSPMVSWSRNVLLARQAVDTGHASGTLPLSCENAGRIMSGEHPLDVLNGRKTRAFYRLIYAPSDREVVCVDRHAHDVAVGRVSTNQDRKVLERVRMYDTFEGAYLLAAARLGVFLPHIVQASVWCAHRDQKGQR
jgi:hypothetical protein